MVDIVENIEEDRDTVEPDAFVRVFPHTFRLLTERAVSLKKSYVNKLHGTSYLKIAVSLSDNSLELYEITASSLSKLCKLSGHSKAVSELVFSPDHEHIVYSASLDGLVKTWDTRASGSFVMEYKDEDCNSVRPLECLDVSCTGRVLCAGSQLVTDDAFLIFWDQRQSKPLGGYWNSHTDDITQVRFHKSKPATLASGSSDGLINIFDITEQSENDALTYSLNVENSVERLSWTDHVAISCVTQSNDIQLWDTESGDMLRSFSREKIARGIKRSKVDDCYAVDTYRCEDNSTAVLAGSLAGNGHCLRSAHIGEKKLTARTNFVQNKQVVRCCWQPQRTNLLVTAGESGIISVWESCNENEDAAEMSSSKITNSVKKRSKPY